MRLSSFIRFFIELKRLRGLASASEYAFKTAESEVRRRVYKKEIDPKLPVSLDPNSTSVVANNAWVLMNSLSAKYPRYIRETLYVRLVSTLEVMLVDVVRDLYFSRTDLLADPHKFIEITHGEILSAGGISQIRNRVINSELRQLHSKGMRDIVKFYEKKFGVKFSDLGINLSVFWEMIDRRHLLVHSLGRADEQYRRKYQYNSKAPLTVRQDYLMSSLDLFEKIGDKLEVAIKEIIESKPPSGVVAEFSMEIEIFVHDAEGERATLPSFAFVVNDRQRGEHGVRLADILSLRQASRDGSERYFISGQKDTLNAYLRVLRKLDKNGHLSFQVHGRTHSGLIVSAKPTSLDETIVTQIAKRLPAQPWPKHIHKIIAGDLCISNSECSKAITLILARPDLMLLLGTHQGVTGQ